MELLDWVDHNFETPRVLPTRRMDQFYASNASILLKNPWGELEPRGGCLRAQYYRITGAPATPGAVDFAGTRKMDYGNAIHDYEVSRFKAVCGKNYAETAMWDPINRISGRVDLIVEDPRSKAEPPELLGIEIKSVAGYSAKVAFGRNFSMERVRDILQVLVYAEWFKHPQHGYMTWYLLYFNRDTGARIQHIIVPTSNGVSVDGEMQTYTVQDIYARWKSLQNYIDTDTEPPRDYYLQYPMEKLQIMEGRQQLSKAQASAVRKGTHVQKGDWQCAWCSYKVLCHNDL